MSRQQQPPQPLWLHINLNKCLGATADLRCESRRIYVPKQCHTSRKVSQKAHGGHIFFLQNLQNDRWNSTSWRLMVKYCHCLQLLCFTGESLWNSRHTEGNPSHLSMQWWPSLWPMTGVGNGQGCLRDIAFLVDLCPQGKTSFKHLTMKNCNNQSLQNREVLRIACEQFLMYLYISHEIKHVHGQCKIMFYITCLGRNPTQLLEKMPIVTVCWMLILASKWTNTCSTGSQVAMACRDTPGPCLKCSNLMSILKSIRALKNTMKGIYVMEAHSWFLWALQT